MGLQRRHLLNRQIQGSKPVNQGWQIVYTGFVLIMLSLFILLTSFASLDPSKITQFVDSFSNAVSVLGGGRSIQKSRTFLPTQVDALSKQDLTAELFEQVRRFSEEEELDQVLLHHSDQGVVMTLIDNLLFDSGKTDLTRDAYPLLQKIARLIDHVRVPVEIGGHTDDRPIQTALFPSNWELSTARAVSVLRYLIEHHGVDAQRLSAVGFAHYQPVSPDDGPLHHAMNRRVEFVFLVEQ
jgi:chemotaxis protein MotB